MIVCHCNAVNDATVLEAIAGGARDIAAVGSACGAGTNCGGCHETIEHLLDAAVAVEEAFVETLVAVPATRARRVREASWR